MFDITIIEGRPACCAATIILQEHINLSVLVIDRGQTVQYKAGKTVPPVSRLLFQQLGIRQEFLVEKTKPSLNFPLLGEMIVGLS